MNKKHIFIVSFFLVLTLLGGQFTYAKEGKKSTNSTSTSSFSQAVSHAIKTGISSIEGLFGSRKGVSLKMGARYLDQIFDAEEIVVTSNIEYGSAINKAGDTEALMLDVYTPPASDAETSRPLAIIIHGGGFSGGDKNSEKIVEWSKEWFAERGYVAASINYRLRNGEENIAMKESMSDAQAAVKYMRAHADEYGIDPNKIITMGASAGAITSLMVGASSEISPEMLEASYEQVKANFSNEGEAQWVCMAVSTSGAIDDGYRAKHLDEFDSPSVDFHGELDTTVPYPDAVQTIEAMQGLGIFAELYSYPDKAHGVDQKDVEEKIFPILYEHVVEGDCPASNMSVSPIDVEDETEEEEDNSSGGGNTSSSGGGGSSGGSKNTPSDIVLPPAPIENPTQALVLSGGSCSPYLSGFVQYGDPRNTTEDMKKLELFLNTQGETLAVDGFYGPLDREAVNRFQLKHASTVLTVWGLTEPTGGVYRTTYRQINEMMCPTFVPPTCPAFTEINSVVNNTNTAEVYHAKLILKSLGYDVGLVNSVFDAPLQNALIAFQQTFHEIMLDPLGLTTSYGNKGTLTNKVFNELVGCTASAL